MNKAAMDSEHAASNWSDPDDEPERSPALGLVESLVPKLAVLAVSVAALLAALMQPPLPPRASGVVSSSPEVSRAVQAVAARFAPTAATAGQP